MLTCLLPFSPCSFRPWTTSLCRRHSDRAAQNKHRADRFPLSNVWESGKRQQKYPRAELCRTMAATRSCFKKSSFLKIPPPSYFSFH